MPFTIGNKGSSGIALMYFVIYDGNCNFCVTLVRFLESFDGGKRFRYVPMQQTATLESLDITPETCEQGMILIDSKHPERRWQGSDAAEEIGRLLPFGETFVNLYRSLPGVKSSGDQVYAVVRDRRYDFFGKRDSTYLPKHPLCKDDACKF